MYMYKFRANCTGISQLPDRSVVVVLIQALHTIGANRSEEFPIECQNT